MTCVHCGGPVRAIAPGVYAHDNASGFYAGSEITHDAEVAMMTRKRALEILSRWGLWDVVPASELKELEAVARPDEPPLHTAMRIGLGRVIRVEPFDHAKIRALIAEAEIHLANEGEP